MKQAELFHNIVDGLIECNSEEGLDLINDFGGIQTSDNGNNIFMSKKIAKLLFEFSKIEYSNFSKKEKIDFKTFNEFILKEVANCISSNNFCSDNIEEYRKIIKDKTFENFNKIDQFKYNYHFPATTLLRDISPLVIGPVHIYSLKDWINTVDFPTEIKEFFRGNLNNEEWKINVIKCLEKKLDEKELDGIAKFVYHTVKNSNSILTVEIKGYEKKLSEKFARQICKSCLDMLSLIVADQRVFYNNVLQLERLPALNYGEFTSSNGFLNLPSSGISNVYLPPIDEENYYHLENLIDEMLTSYTFILNGLVDPECIKFPKLISKWVFALNWFAEGMRESNDAIAVAKLASCLDTLSSSGKNVGIKQIICNAYNCEESHILFDSESSKPITVNSFVKKFYDDGRSRILHGTLENMLESFEVDRNRLAKIARDVLLEFANRLCVYKGEDNEKAFRTMKYES